MPLPALALGSLFAGFSQILARFLVPYIVVKLLIGLGITAFTITGSVWLIGYIETTLQTRFHNIGADVGSVLIMAGMLDALSIIFNCWIAAFQIKSIKGAFKGFKL